MPVFVRIGNGLRLTAARVLEVVDGGGGSGDYVAKGGSVSESVTGIKSFTSTLLGIGLEITSGIIDAAVAGGISALVFGGNNQQGIFGTTVDDIPVPLFGYDRTDESGAGSVSVGSGNVHRTNVEADSVIAFRLDGATVASVTSAGIALANRILSGLDDPTADDHATRRSWVQGAIAFALSTAQSYADGVGTSEASARANAVTSEANARTAADTTNASAIAAEATARGSAVTTLAASITAEASARIAADTTNANAIAAEATARAAADTALQASLDGAGALLGPTLLVFTCASVPAGFDGYLTPGWTDSAASAGSLAVPSPFNGLTLIGVSASLYGSNPSGAPLTVSVVRGTDPCDTLPGLEQATTPVFNAALTFSGGAFTAPAGAQIGVRVHNTNAADFERVVVVVSASMLSS